MGDVFFQNKCFKKMEKLKNSGITILFVSHDMGSIRQLCDVCLWLQQGSMREYGNVEEISASYFNEELKIRNELNADGVKLQNNNEQIEIKQRAGRRKFPLLICKQGLKNDDVIIKSFAFYENGNEVSILKNGHRYKAIYVVEFRKIYENIIIGFILENHKGIPVLGINSLMASEGKIINVDTPGTLVISFGFILPKLMRGPYTVSPAVAQGSQEEHVQLTWLENVLLTEVHNDGYNCSIVEIEASVKTEQYQTGLVDYYEV